MHGNLHGEGKAIRRTIDDPSMQIFGSRIANGMQNKIEALPFDCDLFENRFELPINGNITRKSDLAA
jgi:hypothetical protein